MLVSFCCLVKVPIAQEHSGQNVMPRCTTVRQCGHGSRAMTGPFGPSGTDASSAGCPAGGSLPSTSAGCPAGDVGGAVAGSADCSAGAGSAGGARASGGPAGQGMGAAADGDGADCSAPITTSACASAMTTSAVADVGGETEEAKTRVVMIPGSPMRTSRTLPRPMRREGSAAAADAAAASPGVTCAGCPATGGSGAGSLPWESTV